MKNKKANTKNNAGTVLALGAGVAALAAAGYFFFGPNGKKNQKKMKGWMIKMKGEVVEKLEAVKEVTEPVYNNIVDSVAASYVKTADKMELDAMVKELKRHWKSIAGNGKKPAKKTAKKTAKKAVSKVAKQAAKTTQKVVKKVVKKAAQKTVKKGK